MKIDKVHMHLTLIVPPTTTACAAPQGILHLVVTWVVHGKERRRNVSLYGHSVVPIEALRDVYAISCAYTINEIYSHPRIGPSFGNAATYV